MANQGTFPSVPFAMRSFARFSAYSSCVSCFLLVPIALRVVAMAAISERA